MTGRKPHRRAGYVSAGTIRYRRANDGMQFALHPGQMLFQKRTGKFHGQKLVPFVGGTPGGQWLIPVVIKTGGVGREFRPAAATRYKTVAVEVQAQLHAMGMKTGRPIEFATRKKIVPFEAVTRAAKTAEQRLPAVADIAPRASLTKRGNGVAGCLVFGNDAPHKFR